MDEEEVLYHSALLRFNRKEDVSLTPSLLSEFVTPLLPPFPTTQMPLTVTIVTMPTSIPPAAPRRELQSPRRHHRRRRRRR